MSDSDGQSGGGSRGGKRGGLAGCLLVGGALFFLGVLVIGLVGWFLFRSLMGTDGDQLAVVAVSDPAHGSVATNADNPLPYSPAAGK